MNFIPNTDRDRAAMLQAIGVDSIDALFADIPRGKLLTTPLDLPEPLSELELKRMMVALSERNEHRMVSFLGAGCYQHFIPSVVWHLASRSEFATSYTPYQAEVNQGMLQTMYEFQTMISELTGMDVANASMYDGASALAEAMLMATAITGRSEVLISRAVHPEYRQVAQTYAAAKGLSVVEMGWEDGATDQEQIRAKLSGRVAAVLIQSPNFFGVIEELAPIAELAHDADALLVVTIAEPTSLGMLQPPGSVGADIVVGEGQSLGTPMHLGGPALGFMATRETHVRKLPGRLVGMTLDAQGERGFILTLQAREQHIRREKATSNICTAEALCALAATIYLATLGKGLRDLAWLNVQKARYAQRVLAEAGFPSSSSRPFYNEFVVRCDDPRSANQRLLSQGIIGGVELGRYYPELADCLLFCVTEMHTRQEIDKLVAAMRG